MRVVVLGPYPPSPDPAADAVLDTVRALRAAGATVTVVSTAPSAAPEWGDPTRASDARRVARAVRDADRVVWFGPDGARPARSVRRVLGTVAAVERRTVAVRAETRPSWRARVQRWRAGGPTAVRTLWARGRDRVRPWRR